MMLFDSHAHLNDQELINETDTLIENALKKGVTYITCVGYDEESSLMAIEIAERYDEVFAAIGIHPSEAHHFDMDLDFIEENIDNPKVVAIGEIGLDYYWDTSRKPQQKQLFQRQIALANQYNKPIIIHMRDATEDTYQILKSEKKPSLMGVMHCYSGSKEAAQQFLDLNMYISLAGPVTFKNARVPKEVAKSVPLSRLMVETDAPYLAPMPNRGRTNQPAYVYYVAKEIASIRGISFDDVAKATFNNACHLFGIDQKERQSWD